VAKLKYKLTNDILFKMLFVRNPNLLKKFAAAFLHVPVTSIKKFEITNPEMPPAMIEDKFCRLDITMNVNNQLIDLEVQAADEKDYPDRSLFNWAVMYSSALERGEDYIILPKVIVVSILGFPLFTCKEFHSEFEVLEVKRHERLTDKLNMHYFELPKLPKNVIESNRPDDLDIWLAFFNAKTEADLKKVEAIGGDIMKKAVKAYNTVSTTKEFKELSRMRLKASCNETYALANAEHKRSIEIAKEMLTSGIDVNTVAKCTKLTVDEVLKL